MSYRDYFEEKFGIPLLLAQANQLWRFHGIPEKDYERRNAIEHSYVSAMLQLKYGQNAPNLAKALGHSLEYWQQAVHAPFGQDPAVPNTSLEPISLEAMRTLADLGGYGNAGFGNFSD